MKNKERWVSIVEKKLNQRQNTIHRFGEINGGTRMENEEVEDEIID